MFYEENETEFSHQEKTHCLLNVNFKHKDVFPVLDTDELALHTEAYKGYVRTELVTTTKCCMPPGYVKNGSAEEKQKTIDRTKKI